MKLNFIRLRNFRNAEFAEINAAGQSLWIFGKNAQGKTNLLEAVGALNAARSFRTSSLETLVRAGEKSAQILAEVETAAWGKTEIEMSFGAEKSLKIDGSETKLSEYLGKFPALAITNEDVRLIRGSPEIRRKDMDMFISSIDAEYFEVLRRYYRALAQRNALLKNAETDAHLFDAFESEMAQCAAVLLQKRKDVLGRLGDSASGKYEMLAGQSPDHARISLKPNCDADSAEAFAEMLRKNRPSDAERRTTQKGSHRDDFKIFVDEKDAKLYASEGQQKSAAIALRLAQFEMCAEILREEPLLVCDDILGELDASRREKFWQILSPTAQVVASSTEKISQPDRVWKMLNVENGTFNEC